MSPSLPDIHEIWVYLSGSPLLALVLTLAAYQAGVVIYERTRRNPLANPVAIAVLIVAAALVVSVVATIAVSALVLKLLAGDAE